MKSLFSTAIAATLTAASLVTLTSTDALAQGKGGFDLGTDCNAGPITTNIYTFAACSTNAGNDTGNKGTLITKLNDGSLFSGIDTGATGTWGLLGKSDDGNATVTANNDLSSGVWSVDLDKDFFGDVVVTTKAAKGYFAYLFEDVSGADFTGGQFTVANQKGLSHLTIAAVEKPGAPTPPDAATPEPFSMIGAGLAIGAGAFFKNRKK